MTNKGQKIRFGILCNGTRFQQWQANCLNSLLDHSLFELVLLITPDQMAKAPSFVEKLRGPLFYRQFQNRLMKSRARKTIDLSEKLAHTEAIRCKTIKSGKFAEIFSETDVTLIKSKQLDFMIRFGFGILKGDVLNAASWGIWSYHHGNPEQYRGGPPGFWELIHNNPVTGSVLQRLTEKLDLGIILHQGFFPTVKHSYSEQLDSLLFGSESWIKHAALACHRGNINPETGVYQLTQRGWLFKFPTNWEFIHCFVQLGLNRLRFYRTKYFIREKWTIGVTTLSPEQLLSLNQFDQVNWYPKSKEPSIYKADPFIATTPSGLKVLFERFDYRFKKAILHQARLNAETGEFSEEDVFLKTPEHRSYPYTFNWENEQYFIPESYSTNEVNLYQIKEGKPEKVTQLLSGFKAVDPSLVYFENRFWLFCTEKSASNHQLHIFYSDHLTGPYQAHALNPVKTSITGSRPAGNFFSLNGKLYRPAQNCSKTYGGSLVIQEILELSPEAFSEKPVNEIFPNPDWEYNEGLHTISILTNVVVFDAKKHEFHFDPKGN